MCSICYFVFPGESTSRARVHFKVSNGNKFSETERFVRHANHNARSSSAPFARTDSPKLVRRSASRPRSTRPRKRTVDADVWSRRNLALSIKKAAKTVRQFQRPSKALRIDNRSLSDVGPFALIDVRRCHRRFPHRVRAQSFRKTIYLFEFSRLKRKKLFYYVRFTFFFAGTMSE